MLQRQQQSLKLSHQPQSSQQQPQQIQLPSPPLQPNASSSGQSSREELKTPMGTRNVWRATTTTSPQMRTGENSSATSRPASRSRVRSGVDARSWPSLLCSSFLALPRTASAPSCFHLSSHPALLRPSPVQSVKCSCAFTVQTCQQSHLLSSGPLPRRPRSLWSAWLAPQTPPLVPPTSASRRFPWCAPAYPKCEGMRLV